MGFESRLNRSQRMQLAADVARGLSRNKAAIKYGVSRATVWRILTAENRPSKARKVKPCGTNAAYIRHLRKGEIADQACLDAHAEDQRKWKSNARL